MTQVYTTPAKNSTREISQDEKNSDTYRHQSFYRVIPSFIARDRDLTSGQKILFSVISSLCSQEGYCWASNRYLASEMNCSIPTVKRMLRALSKKELIFVEVEFHNERKIWTIDTWVHKERIAKIEGNTGGNQVSIKDFVGGSRMTRGWITDDPPNNRIEHIDIEKRSSTGGMGGKTPKPQETTTVFSPHGNKGKGTAHEEKKPPIPRKVKEVPKPPPRKPKEPPAVPMFKSGLVEMPEAKYQELLGLYGKAKVEKCIARMNKYFSACEDKGGMCEDWYALAMRWIPQDEDRRKNMVNVAKSAIDENKKYIEKLLSDNPGLGKQIESFKSYIEISGWIGASESPAISYTDPNFHEKFAEWTKKYKLKWKP